MIDGELLAAFVTELDALRGHGADFARTYPDVAARLDISNQRSSDAHVERIVEATAFLAARLRLMIEQSATELPLSMLALIAPSLVEPVPSFAVMRLAGGMEPHVVPRDTRFDARLGAGSLVCFSTTMEVTAAPLRLQVRRLEPTAGSADGIAIRVTGAVPDPLTLYLGNNERAAAALTDALLENLVDADVVPEGGEPTPLARRQFRVHGFTPEDGALPVRPATHPAHRVVTEFLAFPDKFRFVSINGARIRSGDEIRVRFSRPMALPAQLDRDIVDVNRVPVVNLWPTVSSPIDVDGRRLEYPVRVDALRYRTVECHSVESLDIYQGGQANAERLDPVYSLGALRGTAIQWGTRREMSRTGSDVFVFFRGLDYGVLGREQLLATGNVLASNRDIAQHLQQGTPASPIDPAGGWSGQLASAPTPYLTGLGGARALETMVGYLNSGMVGFVGEARRGVLQDYLRRFPGSQQAPWIEGIRGASAKAVMATRGRQPQVGIGLTINYDASSYPATSQGLVKRVLGQLFDSQRGLNRVEQLTVNAD